MFRIPRQEIEDYGAFNISLAADLPLFIDPFLLFNSKKQEYRRLHDQIIKYVQFLRDKSEDEKPDSGLFKAWYRFPEIKQSWLGFSVSGNKGSGLGQSDFAIALHSSLNKLFSDFGKEKTAKGSHLEKLCPIKELVGKDNISDFTTNLIHEYLLAYIERFAQEHINKHLRKLREQFTVEKVHFNHDTETWEHLADSTCHTVEENVFFFAPRDMLTTMTLG